MTLTDQTDSWQDLWQKATVRKRTKDYEETFSPTADMTSVIVILQKAAQDNQILNQMDKTRNIKDFKRNSFSTFALQCGEINCFPSANDFSLYLLIWLKAVTPKWGKAMGNLKGRRG